MIDYFIVDNQGLIIQKGVCHEQSEIPDGNVVLKKAPFDATHYKNNQFTNEPDIKSVLFEVLQKRQALLINTDWTQLPDAPVDKQAWAAYRQHLRDITQQPDFPTKIDWGTPPSEA